MHIEENMTLEQQEIYRKYKNKIPFPLVLFARELGLEIYAVPDFPKHKSGAIQKEDDGTYAIYLNEAHSPKRKRFTLAHEIGHFINDKDYLDDSTHGEISDFSKQSKKKFLYRANQQCLEPKIREMDVKANKFAAEILMPEETFIKIWQKYSTPEEVADYFNVSVDATLIRASQVIGEII